MAPALEYLVVEAQIYHPRSHSDDPIFVPLNFDTAIQQMQIYIHEPHEDRDPSENSDNSDGEWFSTIAPLISILDRSPLLRQLSISPMNATWYYGVFDGLIEMQTVQDLHCQASHSDIENLELENASAKCLGSARRLALESTGWSNVVSPFPVYGHPHADQ